VRRLVQLLASFFKRRQEKLSTDHYFAFGGQPSYCALCNRPIQYPPIRIPITRPTPPREGAVIGKEGYCLNPEVTYARFHINCGLVTLAVLNASDIETKPETKK
jgi:hypothetical protein